MLFQRIRIALFLLLFLFSMCSEKEAVVEKPVIRERIETICVWDRLSLRNDSDKWISALSLGEKVFWLGESKIDSSQNDRRYLKVELSDSTIGWASAWGLVTHARPGALKESAFIYRRPDPLTLTEISFEMMDMVAIIQSKDNWFEVIGERRSESGWKNKSGWITASSVETDPSEVAIAILTTKALREKDKAVQEEKLRAIIKNAPNPNSLFIKKLMSETRYH